MKNLKGMDCKDRWGIDIKALMMLNYFEIIIHPNLHNEEHLRFLVDRDKAQK